MYTHYSHSTVICHSTYKYPQQPTGKVQKQSPPHVRLIFTEHFISDILMAVHLSLNSTLHMVFVRRAMHTHLTYKHKQG